MFNFTDLWLCHPASIRRIPLQGNLLTLKTAHQSLDNLSITWQKEIEDKYSIIDKLYKAYQAEQVLLTEEMKRRRQDEIGQKEKDVKEIGRAHV